MEARLIAADGDVVPEVCVLSPHQPITLGRHRTNTIVLTDRHASRKHAEVFRVNGSWFIRDLGTLNGTRLNGQTIEQPATLADGHEINIGDTRLRFLLEPSAAGLPRPPGARDNGADDEDSDALQTNLHVDELTTLCSFMAGSVEETTARALVERAVAVIHSQTGACLTGFLNLDPDHPLPKVVLPQQASVDAQLSRQLTRLAQQRGRLVWLSRDRDEASGDSLLAFRDALCVPLEDNGTVLGALHVYRSGRTFADRDVRFCEVLAGYLASSLRTFRSRRTLEAENSRLRDHAPAAEPEIIGESPCMQKLKQEISRLAPRNDIVLITGESGVGKELVAMALHQQSLRCDGPLVTVNCAAISASLSDAELFGHREGAFSGANRDRPGFFEQADEGTLFLDEIGDLSLDCQAKLLRVIEGKGFRPVGATADVQADVRILAATNRDLAKMVQEGKFRQDLFFRLGLPLRVPPLRERADDVPALVAHFLPRLSQEHHRSLKLTPAALARLQNYCWPGNVRQLLAVLRNAASMSDGDAIGVHDLRLDDVVLLGEPLQLPTLNLAQLEVWAIRESLRRGDGMISRAAKLLGIHRDTLADKLRKHGIDRDNP